MKKRIKLIGVGDSLGFYGEVLLQSLRAAYEWGTH